MHILCPVDFSEPSRNALRHAVVVARRRRARLTVLFVNDPLLAAAAAAAAYDVQKLTTTDEVELKRFIRRTVGPAAESIASTTALGHPASEIEKTVARLGIDLVVMGTNGLSGPLKWFLGSTTERILHTTKVSVLVVPHSTTRARTRSARALRTWPGRHVVAPIDLDRHAAAHARAAVSVARAFGADATLLHVVAPPSVPGWMRIDSGALARERYAAARAQLEKVARSVGRRTKSQVLSGDPAVQIAECAADLQSGLVVLTLKRSGARGPRRGSITYRVLCHGGVPVLALTPSGVSRKGSK